MPANSVDPTGTPASPRTAARPAAPRVTRRTLLRGPGAAFLVATAGGTLHAVDQGVLTPGTGPAYSAWADWQGTPGDGPLRLIRAAILAANPHNSQPWYFALSADTVDVYADLGRHLGAVDPFLREMHIGLGAAIENLALAAPAYGLAPTVTLGPRPERPEHVAHVTLRPGPVQPSSLFGAIPRRHTNRAPYDTAHSLEPSALTEAAALADSPDVAVRWLTTPDERRRFGAETVAATAAFIEDKEQADAGHAWFRHDWSELQRRRDGVTYDASGIPPWLAALAKLNPFPSARINDDNWLRSTRESHVATASAFGLLLVRDRHDHRQRLHGGRLWQRMHLWAAERGIGMQPLNQLAERADREEQLGLPPRFTAALDELVGDPGWQTLMPFRIGYPTVAASGSPRRAIEDVVLAAAAVPR